ncbi:hypothetical protein FNU79_17145 [Deinococcus detaillensis]|uniref:Uncharacterized protein n=1 Tax=Deinococcus detaillensis TaxID=2592048 RepID=A0A553UIC0_9DEIO|nr:hypothetical protein [Deinococcus detaillensis]TSA79965.1 hypothetical protein FNU79_17145 [Deinococcus detaillensis]
MPPLKTILGTGVRKAAALADGIFTTLAEKKARAIDNRKASTTTPEADTSATQASIPQAPTNITHSTSSDLKPQVDTVKRSRDNRGVHVNGNRRRPDFLAAQVNSDDGHADTPPTYGAGADDYNSLIDEHNRRARAEIAALQSIPSTCSLSPPTEVDLQPSFWQVMNPGKTPEDMYDMYREQAEARRAAHWEDLENNPKKMLKELKKWDRHHRK